jgi:hypothetical protein
MYNEVASEYAFPFKGFSPTVLNTLYMSIYIIYIYIYIYNIS